MAARLDVRATKAPAPADRTKPAGRVRNITAPGALLVHDAIHRGDHWSVS
jgi:hypothetical protein